MSTGIGGLLEMHLSAQATLNGYESILRLIGHTTTADLLRDRALRDVNARGFYRFRECENMEVALGLASVLLMLHSGSFQDFQGYGVNYTLENMECRLRQLTPDEKSHDFDLILSDIRRAKEMIYDHTNLFPELRRLMGDAARTLNREMK